MCANCGCGVAEDKHGDERNITWSEIEAAADANGMSPEQAVANMQQLQEMTSEPLYLQVSTHPNAQRRRNFGLVRRVVRYRVVTSQSTWVAT